MTRPYYRVQAVVGSHSWEVESTDEPGYGPTAPLEINGPMIPDDGIWPNQPAMPTAVLGIVTETAAEMSDVNLGSRVWIKVHIDPVDNTVPIAHFHGRVAEMTASPHQLGMLFTLQCSDYIADTLDTPQQDYPAGTFFGPREVIDYVCGDFALSWHPTPEPSWFTLPTKPPVDEFTYTMGATGSGTKPRYDLVVEYLADYVYWPSAATTAGERGIVHAHLDGDQLAAVQPYQISFVPKRVPTVEQVPPARMALGPAGWGPTLDPDDGYGSLDGGEVQLAAEWVRIKTGEYDRTHLSTNNEVETRVTSLRNRVPVTYTRTKTHISDEGSNDPTLPLSRLGVFLLPETGEPASWQVDQFRLMSYVHPERLRSNGRDWFDPIKLLRRPIVAVANLPVDRNPNPEPNPPWWAGTIAGAKFVIPPGGFFYHDLTILPRLPRAQITVTGTYLTPESMAADPVESTVTVADLDPAFSVYDYRLARRADA